MEAAVEPKNKEVAVTAPRERPFEVLQHTMNRLLDSFRHETGGHFGNGDLGTVGSRMDMSETDDSYEVKVELPGMDEKNVEVSIAGGALTIHGEKTVEKTEKKKNYHYRECSYGSVHRVVPLPSGVDGEKVAATFKKGVLTVTLPKTPEAKQAVRKIEVKS